LKTFKFGNSEYKKLFLFVQESSDRLFTSQKPTAVDYKEAIEAALVEDDVALPAPPLLYAEGPDQTPSLDDDDAILRQVRDLLALGSSGVIFRGCPGTSKTWYAKQIARKLATLEEHIFQIQFHSSFGYEDFVEGYRPDDDSKSGFKVVDKIFLEACEVARQTKTPVVFIIDEINRGDPARVFGELLTYIEFGYRGDTFRRAYTGKPTSIPANLVILGTMNLADKSITQLDLALHRRFDHIDLQPSAEAVEMFLQRSSEFSPEQVDHVSKWFVTLQRLVQIGHTYFKDVVHPEQIRTIWHYRMLPYCEAVLELDPPKLENVRRSFDAMYKALVGQAEEEVP
jgi:MoxR-like ATPase